ncbi:lytic transglycosylase domain-containing protein [Komagataeibacter europaeus]|uniref:lytic transglycosylase domain-containing protein n=1 Tax=Komagataeibacter europaeus TaxID=33995 RepID=UPI0002F57AA8|nr:lytic transglycosylase domain-containing protein [Komagataeibacter europaeus]
MLLSSAGVAYEGYQAYKNGVLVPGEGEGFLDKIPGYTRFNRWWNHKSGADVAPLDQPIQQAAQALAKNYGFDANHFVALLRTEHGGYRNVSGAGAFGPAQLMPGTARALGVADSVNAPGYDWQKNLDAGARYYRQVLAKYHGDYAAADAAYNAGPNGSRVKQFAQTHDLSVLPHETQNYVATIDRLAQRQQEIASRPVSPILAQPPVAVAPVNSGVEDASVPDRYPSAASMSVPSGTAGGDALAQTMQRIQLEIEHKNAPPGTQTRVKKAPPGTRVVNRTPVQQAMPAALTPVGN